MSRAQMRSDFADMLNEHMLADVLEALDDAVDRYIRTVIEIAPTDLARECRAAAPKAAALRATIEAAA